MKKTIALLIILSGSVLAKDVYIKTFERTNIKNDYGYYQFVAKVEIVNTGGEAGVWKAEVHGLDKAGFPIVKQRCNIKTYLPAFGSIKDADEMIFTADEVEGVETWELHIEKR